MPADAGEVRPAEITVPGGRSHADVFWLRLPHRLHDGRQDDEADHYQHAKKSEHQLLMFSEHSERASHGSAPFCGGEYGGQIRLDKRAGAVLMVSRWQVGPESGNSMTDRRKCNPKQDSPASSGSLHDPPAGIHDHPLWVTVPNRPIVLKETAATIPCLVFRRVQPIEAIIRAPVPRLRKRVANSRY